MDFMKWLPKFKRKGFIFVVVIFVVVDRFNKYTNSHPYNASSMTRVFLDNVYKLYGLPTTIVGDKNVIFLSLFGEDLFAC